MRQNLLILLLFLSVNAVSNATVSGRGEIIPVNDGPYIFYLENGLLVKWIRNDVVREEFVTQENFAEVSKTINLRSRFSDLMVNFFENPDYEQSFTGIDSIAVISDIHGQFKTFKKLLTANGIVDKDMNWKFGKGHLVVLGDIFDRGDMVTEVLWNVFTLEKQAEKAGGKVHLLLGNHELMTLNNDLGYINSKYRQVELLLKTSYTELYSKRTVLGRWLRSKPVVITINNILFTHAGLSIQLVRNGLGISQINKTYSDVVMGKNLQTDEVADAHLLTETDDDPLWYRGYFRDTTFCVSRIDSILQFYGKKHIVVGHTSFKEISPLFDTRIIAVDAGIMNDKQGEMLIFKKGVFYRGSDNGKRVKL